MYNQILIYRRLYSSWAALAQRNYKEKLCHLNTQSKQQMVFILPAMVKACLIWQTRKITNLQSLFVPRSKKPPNKTCSGRGNPPLNIGGLGCEGGGRNSPAAGYASR